MKLKKSNIYLNNATCRKQFTNLFRDYIMRILKYTEICVLNN